MLPSRLWMEMRVLAHYLQLILNVLNARMAQRFGGYFRQDLQMKQQHNFTDVLDATTPGEIMPK